MRQRYKVIVYSIGDRVYRAYWRKNRLIRIEEGAA